MEAGDCVRLRGDNEAATAWIERCRGGIEPRSGALVRLLGALEVASGWHFHATHVPGILNSLADGISRWNTNDVHGNLCSASPHVAWQIVELGPKVRELCSTVLASSSSGTHLRRRLNELTWDFLERG